MLYWRKVKRKITYSQGTFGAFSISFHKRNVTISCLQRTINIHYQQSGITILTEWMSKHTTMMKHGRYTSLVLQHRTLYFPQALSTSVWHVFNCVLFHCKNTSTWTQSMILHDKTLYQTSAYSGTFGTFVLSEGNGKADRTKMQSPILA
jgi:hypothetical protein